MTRPALASGFGRSAAVATTATASVLVLVAGMLVHLPFHASWLNQISVIQRKVLTPNDFPSLQAVVDRLDAFERHYNHIATPIEWRFTRRDLADLISRVAAHEHRLQLAA